MSVAASKLMMSLSAAADDPVSAAPT